MKKAEIIDICKLVASEHTGWVFTDGAFKNKEQNPLIKVIHPSWSFSPGTALSQPVAGFLHKNISALEKKLIGFAPYWLGGVFFEEEFPEYRPGIRINDLITDKALEVIQKLFCDGVKIIDKYLDFSSEKSLLESMPKNLEGNSGFSYCLIRAYLGDYDFVRAYRRGEFAHLGSAPTAWIDKIIDHYGIDM